MRDWYLAAGLAGSWRTRGFKLRPGTNDKLWASNDWTVEAVIEIVGQRLQLLQKLVGLGPISRARDEKLLATEQVLADTLPN